MMTYTILRNTFGSLTNNTSTTNLTLGDLLINEETRSIINSKNWKFREYSRNISAVDSQQFYELPADFGKLQTVTFTVDSTIYFPIQIKSREQWDKLNDTTSEESTNPQYFYIFNKQIGFWPTPSANDTNAITVNYLRRHKDLNMADITNITITTLANAGTALTVSGGLTVQMAGWWIRPTFSTTANTGDGQWYEIKTIVTVPTAATLAKPYQGVSIAAGTAACTIGQCSILPEDYQILPVYRACKIYFTSVNPDATRAALYKRLATEKMTDLWNSESNLTTDPSIGGEVNVYNPNDYPKDLS